MREVWKKQVEELVGSITDMVMSGVVPGKRPRGGQKSDGGMLTDGYQDACRHSSISNL